MPSAIFNHAADRGLWRVAILLVAVDTILIGLFLLWAFAGHYNLRDIWVYDRREFSMGEGQLTEQWGFVKLTLASALLAMIAWPRRQLFVWGLCALSVIMLLSDSLQVHERLIDILHPPVAASFERRHIDVIVKFSLAAAPLAAVATGFSSLPVSDRPAMIRLAMPVIVLGFWTSIVDFVHNAIENRFGGGKTIGNLFEEGGEGLLITVVLVVALSQFRRAPRRAAGND